LAVLAKTVYPDFRPESFGSRNLRDFIRKNIPDIAEFGPAGMDIGYQLRATREKAKSEIPTGEINPVSLQLTTNPRVWKTFTSPDSIFRLFLSPQDGIVRILHPSSKPHPEWREIPKISAEALLLIGRDFTSGLQEPQKSVLEPILQEEKWWIRYFETLQSLGIKSNWIEFRRRRIRDEFHRLVGASQPAELPRGEPITPLALSSETVAKTQPESIRKVAAEVVQRMTEAELRALTLPLGYVMDSLTLR